jgi:flagella basal body P-ring formation protein FlgA
MRGAVFLAAVLGAAVVFCSAGAAEIQPAELTALGLREIKALPRFAAKEVELTLPPNTLPVPVSTENYTLKAQLSTKELGPTMYIKYSVYDLDQNFLKAFRIKCQVAVWDEAFYAKRMLYKGEEVRIEDFYPLRTDILKHSKYLAEPTVFRAEQILTADLRPDEPLFAWMLSVKKLINSGDRVALSVLHEGVSLQVESRALQAGVLGEKILVQVQNEKRRILKAEIIAPGKCQIEL